MLNKRYKGDRNKDQKKKKEKKEVCTIEAQEVIIPHLNWAIHCSHYRGGASPRDFVRFIVYDEQKPRNQRTNGAHMLVINDHRVETLRAARSPHTGTRLLPGRGRVPAKTMSFSEAVRLPARVVVMKATDKRGTVMYVNLYQPERKATGLFFVVSELLAKEKFTLGTIKKSDPLWCWGERKDISFGPTGYALPVVALTNEQGKIIFHCRKSGDIVTLGSEIKAESMMPL